MKPLKQGPTPQPRTNRQRKPYAQKKLTEHNPNQNKAEGPVPVKKSRTSQSKASPTPIQCLTCKQTDVPLILGGSAFHFLFKFFSMSQSIAITRILSSLCGCWKVDACCATTEYLSTPTYKLERVPPSPSMRKIRPLPLCIIRNRIVPLNYYNYINR